MKTVSLIKHKREEGIQFPPYPITEDPHNFQKSWLISANPLITILFLEKFKPEVFFLMVNISGH